MIAIVSSTVAPSGLPGHDGARTTLTPEVRLEQTKGTVASLVAAGARSIIIADNSPGSWFRERAAVLAPAQVLHMSQPPIRNKGIGELWLLLSALETLPEDQPIMKISGRYRVGPATDLRLGDGDDIVAKVSGSPTSGEMSTRCYLMRNRAVAAAFWERSLDEFYAERSRIVGPRSLIRILRNSINPQKDNFHYADTSTLSLEQASLKAIRHLGLHLRIVAKLDVEGILGIWKNPLITE
jgi:hypothetical protein